MNKRSKLRVAVWGLGKHAIKNILPALAHNLNIVLVGVCSRNKSVVQECVENFNCMSWDSPEEMLSAREVDTIYLSTPIGLHVTQCKQVLDANKHCWCEKPMATNSEDVQSLIDLARQKKLTLCEGFMYLHHPQFIWLQQHIQQVEFGDIKSIRCQFGLPFLDAPGFRYQAEFGGSALWDVGCYPLSAILELLPNSEPALKYVRLNKLVGYDVDMEGMAIFDIEDNIEIFLEWGNGRSYRNEIEIWGSQTSVYTDKIFSKPMEYEPIFVLTDNNGNKTTLTCSAKNHFTEMFDYFGELVGNDTLRTIEYERILRRVSYLGALYDAGKK